MRKLTVMALAASLALGVGSAWAQPQQNDDTPPCWQDGGMMMGSGYHPMMWRDGHHGRYRGGAPIRSVELSGQRCIFDWIN